MSNSFDNIHPGLTHEAALKILLIPVDQLESMSDYYMATSHLINFPGSITEKALLQLVENKSKELAIVIARRKAVEVLARLDCQDAIKSIGDCLNDTDHYLVENAAWALRRLNSQDSQHHQIMIGLLDDPSQNQRILIQSLAALGVKEALSKIKVLAEDSDPGVRGAALSALVRLDNQRECLQRLEPQLTLPNQMNRQSAIQDVIDCKAFSLLPAVLHSPVSPAFRMRALEALWPQGVAQYQGFDLIRLLDDLLLDHPNNLELIHQYEDARPAEFLVQELFSTDFSRCYLALKTLSDKPSEELWPLLEKRWYGDAYNDYGAHYFFVCLFGLILDWRKNAKNKIETILLNAIDNQRPQFLKSRPAAILALSKLNPEKFRIEFRKLISLEHMPFWQCRYAALLSLGNDRSCAEWQYVFEHLHSLSQDTSSYVCLKINHLIASDG